MTQSPRWTAFRRLLRELFQVDPRYNWGSHYSPSPWRPPSEVTPLPARPLILTCASMGLDPKKMRDEPTYQASRPLMWRGG